MDPLQVVIEALVNANRLCPVDYRIFIALFTIDLAVMVICLCRHNILGVADRKKEQEMVRICHLLMNRIETLMPVYRVTVEEYTKHAERQMLKVNGLTETAKGIPYEEKVKAERDFFLHDSSDAVAIATLQLQFESLKATVKEKEGGSEWVTRN